MTTSGARSRLNAEDWLNAGLKLLADDGLAGVKIDVLAGRLGVTKGSFYWHFDGLPAFLDALADHWCARRDADVEAFPLSAPAEPAGRLMYLMERISDRAAWNLERAIRAWAYSDPRLQAHVAALDKWAFGQVRDCFEQLGFAGIDADIRAKTLYYAGIGFVHTGSLGPRERREHRVGLLELLTAR
jgi:AcrR family transcriptional regulator